MKRLIIIAAVMFGLGANAYAAGQGKDAILGKWLTEKGKSVVQVYHCGDAYCGKIIWLKEPLDKQGKEKLDTKNPDKSKRNRKILGLVILTGLKYKGPNKWEGGRIYDPERGKTYKCHAWFDKGKLKLRGYIGFSLIGRTTTWTRKE